MERLLQLLDEFDDAVFAVLLHSERIRRALQISGGITAIVAGALLVPIEPPLAGAVVALLAVTALYRAAVHNVPRMPASG